MRDVDLLKHTRTWISVTWLCVTLQLRKRTDPARIGAACARLNRAGLLELRYWQSTDAMQFRRSRVSVRGAHVRQICDPRHVGRVVSFKGELISVRWQKTGWRSDIPANKLEEVPAGD